MPAHIWTGTTTRRECEACEKSQHWNIRLGWRPLISPICRGDGDGGRRVGPGGGGTKRELEAA